MELFWVNEQSGGWLEWITVEQAGRMATCFLQVPLTEDHTQHVLHAWQRPGLEAALIFP